MKSKKIQLPHRSRLSLHSPLDMQSCRGWLLFLASPLFLSPLCFHLHLTAYFYLGRQTTPSPIVAAVHFVSQKVKDKNIMIISCCRGLPLVVVVSVAFLLESRDWVNAWSTGRGNSSVGPSSRRRLLVDIASKSAMATSTIFISPSRSVAADNEIDPTTAIQVVAQGDAKKLFNEARAFESQGNMAAAQRLYGKVTRIAPRFVYGWSNLANTLTALGDLDEADKAYTTAIDLCIENNQRVDNGQTGRKCNDLYVLHLNRGSLRLNNGFPKEALDDLRQSDGLRGRPDLLVLQNLARAEEVNGLYPKADKDYGLAVSMSGNDVSPFWLRSAIVKYQLGDIQGGFDLLKRVDNRFPEAPEVRAAYACFLFARGDEVAARQKFLEIPNKQRLNYSDSKYLSSTIAWPPAMKTTISKIASAVGDS